MPTPTYTRPNFTDPAQEGTAYRANLDTAAQLAERLGLAFLPQAQSTPNMTVRVLAGALMASGALVEVAAQNSGTITAPVTNPRIDRVVIDAATGVCSVVTGTESPSPVAPAIPSGKLPVCRFQLSPSTIAITNTMIVDERAAGSGRIVPAGIYFAAAKRALARNTTGAGYGEEVTISQMLDWIATAAQGDILFRGASGWSLLPAGTAGQLLKTNGAGADPAWASGAGIALGTPITTTGTSAVDRTGLPAGRRRVTAFLDGVSVTGSDNLRIQIGDSSGVKTSGYIGGRWNTASPSGITALSAGFDIPFQDSAAVVYGKIVFDLVDATNNIWEGNGVFVSPATSQEARGVAGRVALTGDLDRVRLTVSGSNTFDQMSFNTSHEG